MPVVTQGSCLQSFFVVCCLFWCGEGTFISITQNISRPHLEVFKGVIPMHLKKWRHHHALDDIHTSWGSVISRQIPPEVNGVWSVCVGVQILNLRLSRWPKMSRDEINMHKKWHIQFKTFRGHKKLTIFLHFRKYLGVPKKTKVGQPWRLTRISVYDRIHPIHGTIAWNANQAPPGKFAGDFFGLVKWPFQRSSAPKWGIKRSHWITWRIDCYGFALLFFLFPRDSGVFLPSSMNISKTS